ncbi:MAG TPA: Tad domain-containing protein [Candidatus Methylomirabilis sp.]|nr:Tad domain-containing protein [Candidatus Methylomirabilis sp.]
MPLSFWRSQRGQTTAMIIVMLWVFVLIVGMVANVGQAVNRRIALQTVADTGAFTGATVMAEGLNYIAFANWWIQNIWSFMTWAFWAVFILSGADCDSPNSVISTYEGLRAPFAAGITTINTAYSIYPYAEARRISAYNVDDLFPGEGDQFAYQEIDIPDVVCTDGPLCRDATALMSTEDVPDGTSPEDAWVPSLFDSVKEKGPIPCLQQVFLIKVPSARTYDFNVWYQRSGTNPRYFVWVVKAPATKAFMFDFFFGPNAIPEMTAVGVAKPVGGSIVKGQAQYVAKIVQASNAMPVSGPCPFGQGTCGFVTDSALPGFRYVTH